MARSRSMLGRQHCSRIPNRRLLPAPDQSRYDCVSISDCCRSAVPPGQLSFIDRCLTHRSCVFGLLLYATDCLFPGKRSVRGRVPHYFFDHLNGGHSLPVTSAQAGGRSVATERELPGGSAEAHAYRELGLGETVNFQLKRGDCSAWQLDGVKWLP